MAPHPPPQLLGFGSALLDNVDPNPENFVGAGIIQTKALQVGCLLRLEPNAQAQVSVVWEAHLNLPHHLLLRCALCDPAPSPLALAFLSLPPTPGFSLSILLTFLGLSIISGSLSLFLVTFLPSSCPFLSL